jgi:very-short-patch-repair endonuclease
VPSRGGQAWIATNSSEPVWTSLSIAELAARSGIDPFPGVPSAENARSASGEVQRLVIRRVDTGSFVQARPGSPSGGDYMSSALEYWTSAPTLFAIAVLIVGAVAVYLLLRRPDRYERREFMNPAERRLYFALERAAPDHVILPQTSMAAIIRPVAKGRRFDEQFGKIAARRVDFALMNRLSGRIDCIVELDGASHDTHEQRKHDAFRDAAFARAGIPTVRFRTGSLPTVDEIRRHVTSAMESFARREPR